MTTQTGDRLRAPLAATLQRFFTTKTSCDVEGATSYFAPDLVTHTDATLGWDFDSFQELRNVFEQYMPGWKPPVRSYATAILSNDVSALVHVVDTPELFGGELRILAAVDFRDGKIVRWVDYWNAVPYDEQLYAQFRTPGAKAPFKYRTADTDRQASGQRGLRSVTQGADAPPVIRQRRSVE
jgi:ketosteroid isomerase-like protein